MVAAVLLAYTVVTSAWLLSIVRRDPGMLLRPSMLILIVVHIRVQWPVAVSQDYIASLVHNTTDFNVLVHGFVFVATSALWAVARHPRKKPAVHSVLWGQATRPFQVQLPLVRRHLPWILAITLAIAGLYLATVPIRSTGLYALLTDPTGLRQAREDSLKGITSPLVAYLTGWQLNTFAPLLVAIGVVMAAASPGRRGLGTQGLSNRASGLIVALSGMLMMSVTGSRAGVVFTVVVAAITYAVPNWHRIGKLLPLGLATFFIIIVSTAAITVAREGRVMDTNNLVTYTEEVGLGRIFRTPVKVGAWYAQYAETEGRAGIAAVRPLARLYDLEFIPLARQVGQRYVSPGSPDVISNSNFLFVYYAAFGLLAIPISLVGVFLLDLLLIPLARLPDLALPMVSVLTIKGALMTEGVFTTSLVTGGYVLLPALVYFGIAYRSSRPSVGRTSHLGALPVAPCRIPSRTGWCRLPPSVRSRSTPWGP
jgi:hypothetical protein